MGSGSQSAAPPTRTTRGVLPYRDLAGLVGWSRAKATSGIQTAPAPPVASAGVVAYADLTLLGGRHRTWISTRRAYRSCTRLPIEWCARQSMTATRDGRRSTETATRAVSNCGSAWPCWSWWTPGRHSRSASGATAATTHRWSFTVQPCHHCIWRGCLRMLGAASQCLTVYRYPHDRPPSHELDHSGH